MIKQLLICLQLQDVIRAIRNIRTEKNVKPGKTNSAIIAAAEKGDRFRKICQHFHHWRIDQEKFRS
jgi:valyl-tRNA synthetase